MGNLVLSQMLQGSLGLGGRNNWPGNGTLKEAEEQMLKCALLQWKVPLSAVEIIPG